MPSRFFVTGFIAVLMVSRNFSFKRKLFQTRSNVDTHWALTKDVGVLRLDQAMNINF